LSSYIAFDLGASNGRCMVGQFDGERLKLEELHRFENRPIELHGRLFWDILGIYENVRLGLLKVGQNRPPDLVSLGVDTWGCDFALLDEQGKLVGNPYCYRDPQTSGMFEVAFRRVPKDEIFRQTGLQFMELNSLFQLLAMQVRDDPAYRIAATFLHIPDLIHYWLTGARVSEYTNASTSQMLDAHTRDWAYPLIRDMGFPERIFPPVVQPGTGLGKLRSALVSEVSLDQVQVVATATHDTAAAIVAAPAGDAHFAYISSGTWALLGREIDQPLVTEACLRYNITNEGGAFNKITLLRNIANLWLIQECHRQWGLEGEALSWEQITRLADQAQPFLAFLDPDDKAFLLPGNMPRKIQEYCQRTHQAVPQDKSEIVRVALESLAMKYRYILERVVALTDHPVEVVHIIGGGSRNWLLDQFSANAMRAPVLAGPYEATIIGNILVQMVSSGDLGSLVEARNLVRRSFPVEEFTPQDTDQWEEQYQLFIERTGLPPNNAVNK